MIIMGIDPGIARIGWAVVDEIKTKLTPLAFGCLETGKEKHPETRLEEIYDALMRLFAKHNPDVLAVEDLFFATNAKTAIGVGQSRGVVLLAASKSRIPVVSYTPLAVKKAITGDGKADKGQVGRMVVLTLRLTKMPKPDDTTDALAIAMTHAYSYRIKHFV